MQIEAAIRTYIAQNLLFSDTGYPYGDESSFLQEGVVDSLGIMELVTFVSTEFGFQVQPDEVTPENFDSVTKLSAYIRRKQDPNKQLIAA